MNRFTNTDKWRDTFFYNLTPAPKLVFIYLYENCNDAGFMDLNYEQMQDLMKLDKGKLEKCLTALESRYIKNSDGTKIWLKNFLLHQNKLPLPVKTEEGRRLLHILESNLIPFDNNQFLREIISDSLKKKGRVASPKETKPFVKPTLDEAQDEFANYDPDFVTPEKVETLWLFYESKGWKVGKSPMVDWVAAFRGCFIRDKKRGGGGSGLGIGGNDPTSPVKPTRLDKIKEASKKEIDYDLLKNGNQI